MLEGLFFAVAFACAVGAVVLYRHKRRERQLFAALLEQGRREAELAERPAVLVVKKPVRVELRTDQRTRMVQQRLSRLWGKSAFSDKMKTRIEEALRGVDDSK